MYLQNKYLQWYYSIVTRAKSRTLPIDTYVEKHHIVPKSLGGSNAKDNLVKLTAREHFICHLLLPKFTSGKDQISMLHAAWRMCCKSNKGNNKRDYRITSSIYELLRKQRVAHLKTLTGELSPNFGRKTGRVSKDFTPEWRAKISSSRKGKSSWNKGIARTPEEKAKMSTTKKAKAGTPGWNVRPPCTLEKAQKIRKANLGKKWVHKLNPIQRQYVSNDAFVTLCESGWIPGTGPKNLSPSAI